MQQCIPNRTCISTRHEAVHRNAVAYQLELGGIPDVLVRLPLLQLLQGVSPLSRVIRVCFEGFSCPTRRRCQAVVLRCPTNTGRLRNRIPPGPKRHKVLASRTIETVFSPTNP